MKKGNSLATEIFEIYYNRTGEKKRTRPEKVYKGASNAWEKFELGLWA
jgi:hypothetical protein